MRPSLQNEGEEHEISLNLKTDKIICTTLHTSRAVTTRVTLEVAQYRRPLLQETPRTSLQTQPPTTGIINSRNSRYFAVIEMEEHIGELCHRLEQITVGLVCLQQQHLCPINTCSGPNMICVEELESCPINETCYTRAVCRATTCPAILARTDYGCTDEPSMSSCNGDQDCESGKFCCYNGPTCKPSCITRTISEYPSMDIIITLNITENILKDNLREQLIYAASNKVEELFNGIKYFAGVTFVSFSTQTDKGLTNMTVTLAYSGNRSADEVFIVNGLAAWFHEQLTNNKTFHFNDLRSYAIVRNQLSSKIFFNIKFRLNGIPEEISYLGPCDFIKIRRICGRGNCLSGFNPRTGISVTCE
ncbi:hypothetical protein LSH36_90g03011 [Paralvinella palmiformis]|uniref:WAP domain-containing protein n=1 Tax=Paralvinella palmiformis TaxID=53620 RepID=A0AAD9K1X4_9ANNE|nr:hypothetical protein LSH36_90g03011 [Paralvinella palmiformis]